ncbi:iron-sulfur cluster assembly scaffold protein [uncultured Desulfobacter sp.]|uniref:iron-sulfur cluster assembly scaffold protein n=1 Tax=uncultured Desulfobacter sp. TaxID=240139 RepID=UPI002AABEF3F|nr:iron-sulfur cluster assembly scaffold protein [uncultured Desulfobacter sp.]
MYEVVTQITIQDSERKMLSEAGYGDPAIEYYLEKKHMGSIEGASQISFKVGSCGDTMKIYLKVDNNNVVLDAKYEIAGCAGAISAAMATVDLVKGKTVEQALKVNDGDVFRVLESIPEKKHHCIQLAVKTMHLGLEEFKMAQAS